MLTRTLLTAIAAAMLVLALPAPAQTDFSSLEELMSGEEFERTGLDKLSDEELAELNAWIRDNLATEVSTVSDLETRQRIRREVEAEFEAEKEGERKEFVATIPGHFTGWTGDTVFELENGQIWRQTTGGTYRVSMDDPAVVLYPAAFGGWRLRLQDYGPSIGVERVK